MTHTTRLAAPTNVVARTKGEERYIFLYDNESAAETLNQVAVFANDPELSFDWRDAAIVSQGIGRLRAQQGRDIRDEHGA